MPGKTGSLKDCQELLGVKFKNPPLLEEALTHASCRPACAISNDRLEFLGDAVVGMVISEHLFNSHREMDEGDLTQIKGAVVSRPALAAQCGKLGLWRFMRVGKGLSSQEQMPVSLLANVFEAVVGAIYLDGGFEAAREFVLRSLREEIEAVRGQRHHKNYKSLLQEFAQRELGAIPKYVVVSEDGPGHMKTFEVAAVVDGKEYEPAKGRTKKEAQQNAAMAALQQLSALHGRGRKAK